MDGSMVTPVKPPSIMIPRDGKSQAAAAGLRANVGVPGATPQRLQHRVHRQRVAAARNRKCRRTSDCLTQYPSAFSELVELEYAYRTVPDDGPGVAHYFGKT